MVELLLKPKPQTVFRFFSQYHVFLNPFFPREFDEISHWSRQLLVFFLIELDLFITILAAIGIVATSPQPDFLQVFSQFEGFVTALAVFLIVPIIVLIIELVIEYILKTFVEDEAKSKNVRTFVFILFLSLVWGTFLALFGLLLGLGLTDQTSVIQVGAVIWAIRFFIAQIINRPIFLVVIYFLRKQFGKERGTDPEPKKCPGVLCCA